MFCRFRIIPAAILDLKRDVRKTLSDSLIREFGVTMDEVIDFDKVVSKVYKLIVSTFIEHFELCYIQHDFFDHRIALNNLDLTLKNFTTVFPYKYNHRVLYYFVNKYCFSYFI